MKYMSKKTDLQASRSSPYACQQQKYAVMSIRFSGFLGQR
jgi:hypothetical protein